VGEPILYVDADGCPVKTEIYRVAQRHGLKVVVVANAWLAVPKEPWLERVVVNDRLDAADDWIAGHAGAGDIVVSGDIPLASRCLKRGARVVGPTGRLFTEATIGEALAGREIQSHLREMGVQTGGPAPFGKAERSRFLQRLEELARESRGSPTTRGTSSASR
jgi:uncharacterized protein YaiI (UPF0178 family)